MTAAELERAEAAVLAAVPGTLSQLTRAAGVPYPWTWAIARRLERAGELERSGGVYARRTGDGAL